MRSWKIASLFAFCLVTVLAGCSDLFTAEVIQEEPESGATDSEESADVEGISVYPAVFAIQPGQTSNVIEARIVPENISNAWITWESQDESVATVDSGGVVTAVSEGTTWITATTSDGEHSEHVFVLSGDDVVGRKGPAGGTILYHDDNGDHEWDYLELAPEETEWVDKPWGGKGRSANPHNHDDIGVGDGKDATDRIVRRLGEEDPFYENYDDPDWQSGEYAARLARSLVHEHMGRTFGDWFLPSQSELRQVLWNLGAQGDDFPLAEDLYWSSSEEYDEDSSEVAEDFAVTVTFGWGVGDWEAKPGDPVTRAKDDLNRVRAVRSFSPDVTH